MIWHGYIYNQGIKNRNPDQSAIKSFGSTISPTKSNIHKNLMVGNPVFPVLGSR